MNSFQIIYGALEKEFMLEEAEKPKNKSEALYLVTETIEINSYLDDDEEIYFEEKHAKFKSRKVKFGTHYPKIKQFISDALKSKDAENSKLVFAIKDVEFCEHEWESTVEPHCGSVTNYVIKIRCEEENESFFYEDPDEREIHDKTFGPMW